MDIHYISYLTGRNLENRKKLTLVRIMNSANMNSKNIVNNVGTSDDSVAMNSNFKD